MRNITSRHLQALIVEGDPLVAAFLEHVLHSRRMEVDCISLPGRFDRLLRENYNVAVVGGDGERRMISLVLSVLQRRRIPCVLFSTGINAHWISANFPHTSICYYNPTEPDRIGDDTLNAILAGTGDGWC